ncbi:MAG: family 16 glycosylhydrolase [Granulosicoccus sp.]
MNSHTQLFVRTIAVGILSVTMTGCGKSDLVDLQERELNDARVAAAQNPSLGAGVPDGSSDGETGGGATGGTDTSGDGSTDSGSADGTSDSGTTDEASAGTDGGSTDGSTDSGGSDGGTSGQSPNAVDLSLYNLVFNDEFQGNSIDSAKWNTALPWGPDLVVYDQLQYYVDQQNMSDFGYNPFSFDGENLTISAIETPDSLRASSNEQAWLSGVLTSAEKFDFTYGYVEARVDLQSGRGIWPSFWMLSSEFEGLKPELFIMEYDGAKPDSIFHNYNYQDADGNLRSPGQWEVVLPGISDGFHTIGLAWSPEELLYYIDGEPRYRIVGENVSSQDMYMILNLAMGGIWPGAPDGTTVTPATLSVDYVRVYQLR